MPIVSVEAAKEWCRLADELFPTWEVPKGFTGMPEEFKSLIEETRMEKTVVVINVEQDIDIEKRDGGTYKGTKLAFQDSQFAKEKAFHSAVLSRNQALADKLHSLEAGQQVTLVMEKNGMFTNVVDIIDGATEEGTTFKKKSPTHTPAKKTSFVDNSIGLQVGNALTNAATLIAAGKAKGTLEEVASMVITTGESLKAKIAAGTFSSTEADVAEKTTTEDVVVDEDIPFGS